MGDDFYAELPAVERFLHLAALDQYRSVPDDTVLFVGDVVDSTAAIRAGRYKEVNVAAAAIIAAIGNALPRRAIAFSFGGDGASFVLPSHLEEVGRRALAGTVLWSRRELKLELRAAAVPVSAIREAGLDLRLARFAVAPELSYAMFSGGGLAWAEAEMKAGRFAVEAAADALPPDLSGLSCNFASLPARNGTILSLIVVPADLHRIAEFSTLVASVLAAAQKRNDDIRPLTKASLKPHWTARNFMITARAAAARRSGLTLGGVLRSGAASAISNFTFRTGRRIGGFDPSAYLGDLVRNTDFRKFDDGLRMTLDCEAETADEIEALLSEAERDGLVMFGTHRQEQAMLTCFVPSPYAKDHVHFVDGAAGGYAFAAQAIKRKRAASADPQNRDAGGREIETAE